MMTNEYTKKPTQHVHRAIRSANHVTNAGFFIVTPLSMPCRPNPSPVR